MRLQMCKEKRYWGPVRTPSSIGMCGDEKGFLGSHQGARFCREEWSWRGSNPAPAGLCSSMGIWGLVTIPGHSKTPPTMRILQW